MKNDDLLKVIKSRVARMAVGASAVRGRGHTGTVQAAREFLLQRVDLEAFGTSDENTFAVRLNRTTRALLKALPRPAQHWGLARKVLNLFLLDCFYNTYLNEAFHLSRAEQVFELPLDSITGTQLSKAASGKTLPPWPGVKHLTPDVAELFQTKAADEARQKNIARVHLDALWWSAGRD